MNLRRLQHIYIIEVLKQFARKERNKLDKHNALTHEMSV